MAKELSSIAKDVGSLEDASQFADLEDPFAKYSAALVRLVLARADTIGMYFVLPKVLHYNYDKILWPKRVFLVKNSPLPAE